MSNYFLPSFLPSIHPSFLSSFLPAFFPTSSLPSSLLLSLPSCIHSHWVVWYTEHTMSSKSLQSGGGKLLVQESPVWWDPRASVREIAKSCDSTWDRHTAYLVGTGTAPIRGIQVGSEGWVVTSQIREGEPGKQIPGRENNLCESPEMSESQHNSL